jgi:phosphatidylserine decarboxylase
LKIARDSRAWISLPIVTTALLAALGSWYAAAVALFGSAFIIFFHRDPDRFPLGEGMISPADGRIVEALPERIAIFMGPCDVHVNRAPLDGAVMTTHFKMGGHLPAFLSSARKNQKNQIEIQTEAGDLELCQITGAFVRRIMCYVNPGDKVARGERIGMIRFGSRVEVTIPEGYRLFVKTGDRVRAGETVIAVRSS